MGDSSGIKPFLCDTIDKANIRNEWQKWIRSFRLYLDSEIIAGQTRKRNKLLHLGGSQLQEVAYSIPGAVVDEEESFDILVGKLTEYFSPIQNSTFERHTFRNIKADKGETLNKFLLRVRQQASKCIFGSTSEEALEINIKDKLIDDWAPVELKRKLLEKERPLTEIIDLCQIHEQIKTQTNVMDAYPVGMPSTSSSVNKINVNATMKSCGRCGSVRHDSNFERCPAKVAKCYKCDRVGHFSIKCHTKSQKRPQPRSANTRYNKRGRFSSSVRYVDNPDDPESGNNDRDSDKNYECFKLNVAKERTDQRDELMECCVGGVPVTLLIDSGSKVNIINGSDWKHLKSNEAVVWNVESDVKASLKSYAVGQPLEIQRQFETTIMTPDKKEIITSFLVVKQGDISILGKETAQRLGVLKIGLDINRIVEIQPFPKIRNVIVQLSIDQSVKPVQQPLRRVPIAIEPLVQRKLEEALQRDIIEPVEGHSPWISPIVITFKADGDIRICIDMRRANQAILRENYPLPTFDTIMTKLAKANYFSRLDLEWAYHQIELDPESRPITTFITHRGMFRTRGCCSG
ncbi:uncharacterized protein K02A2.6-like [Sitophilus oryzae]|uniref:Uncharacterized protein K02A2.6-like n=1 Tax=Sitophilus oryzae TaxID=7048 RepID=A0A6J2XIV8_SITOR|nr:uncharacterized protein K02A2.6-like [Sitophilus oryzae]